MLCLNVFLFLIFLGEKCYKVGGRKEHERVSFDKSLERCRNYGADLASIESQEEQGMHLINVSFKDVVNILLKKS